MDNREMARILQNMIDEASEHLADLSVAFKDHYARVNLESRKADLAEAIKLKDELESDL